MSKAALKRHAYGFLELEHKPDPGDLARYYREKYFQTGQGHYQSRYSENERRVIERRIALRAAHIHTLGVTRRCGTLLDAGCGEGFVLAEYRRRGWTVKGLDYSTAGVRAVNPACTEFVEEGDVYELLERHKGAGARYDLLWLGNVLEHVLDPVDLLLSLPELLCEAGVLVVTVPNDGSAYQQRLVDEGLAAENFWAAVPDHISYFTAGSLRHTAEATGWSVLDVQGDFPIDMYLANRASNYALDKSLGANAHEGRLLMEALISEAPGTAANRFYSALADVGLGRNLTAYLTRDQQLSAGATVIAP